MPEKSGRPALQIPEDPQLPQLAAALDVRKMSSLLPLPPGSDVSKCRVAYIRYKPGTNCLVLYQIQEGDQSPVWAYAKILSQELRPLRSGRRQYFHYHPDLRMIIAAFPDDLKMPALRLAHSRSERQRVLTRLIASKKRGAFQPYWGDWTPIRYKPERRCVLQGSYADPREPERTPRSFYARFYAGQEAARTAAWHRHLAHLCGTVKVPRLLGYSARHKVLLVDRVKGRPLHDFLERDKTEQAWAMGQAAQALARWHRLPPPASASPLPPLEGGLRAAAQSVAILLPEAATLSLELCRKLIRDASPPARDPVLLHGDFYYDQLTLRRSGVTALLDLDELALGQPNHDVATFCSHLLALAVQGKMTRDDAAQAAGVFIETYQRAADRPIPEESLRLDFSAALLRLAPLPFRMFVEDWRSQTMSLLQLAVNAAGGARCF